MFDKPIEKLRADVDAAQERLRQARADLDPALSKDEMLFLLQPFALEVHRAQEALWQRLPADELEVELQRRRDVLHGLNLHDPKRSGAMVAVSDLDRYLHPRRAAAAHKRPVRAWVVAGLAVSGVIAAVAIVVAVARRILGD